jgi:WD40 repeat protein
VLSAAFDPTGRYVLTAGDDHTARLWDLATEPLAGPPFQHGSPCRPDGWMFFRYSHVAFSPDSRWVVSVADKTAQVWDATTGRARGAALRHTANVTVAAFSPDGRLVVTATDTGTAQLWDAATGQAAGPPLAHPPSVRNAVFSRDGRFVVTSIGELAGTRGSACIWETATGRRVGEPITHSEGVVYAELSPDNRLLVTTGDDSAVRVWDVSTRRLVGLPPKSTDWSLHAPLSPDGQLLITREAQGYRVRKIGAGFDAGHALFHAEIGWHAEFSPDGRRLVTCSGAVNASYGEARIWDAATGQPITPPLRHPGRVNHASFSPDGSRVVTAALDRTARVWDTHTGEPLSPPLPHPSMVVKATFSPNGKFVATMCSDGSVRVWDFRVRSRSPSEWTRLALVLSSHKLHESGDLVPLGPAEVRTNWRALHSDAP